ncbi:MAG: hypothetical protein KC444_03425 [Nitrosopumilus sp.]|nr:hypothetical protein [Nitrosopumilus sp.]
MKNQNDKFGAILSIVITAMALGFVASLNSINDGSISSQGERVIDRTVSELENVPDKVQDLASEALETTDTIIEKSDSVSEALDMASNMIEDELPDVPKVVKQTDGKLLELVSIPPETGVPGCELSNLCYLPANAMMSPGGEVIWANHDTVAHTITSGNPQDGPNGLFDSGLLMPNKTYSMKFDLAFEYDYFCLVHPWMQGTIVVQ